MDTVQDFEDLLELLERFEVRYLIIGGLAFIYHAKPRYTKDMDLWIGPDPENIARANRALAEVPTCWNRTAATKSCSSSWGRITRTGRACRDHPNPQLSRKRARRRMETVTGFLV